VLDRNNPIGVIASLLAMLVSLITG